MKRRKVHIDSLSERELLRTPLGHLDLDLERSPVLRGIRQLANELRSRRVNFEPHLWLSDEWFCPDGVPGVAVPFYLAHPRLVALEERWIGYAEGSNHQWLMKLLRHETGHAIENAFGLRRHPLRQEIFGLSRVPYPKSYVPRPYSRSYVQHLSDNYAQSHPDEDFAETFAIWLTPGSNWRKLYSTGAVRRKLDTVDAIMRSLEGKPPVLRNRHRIDPIEKCDQKLGSYLASKRRRLGLGHSVEMDANLRAIFPSRATQKASSGLGAARFLKSHRQQLSREIANGLGEYQYRIARVISRLAERARELDLRVDPSQSLRPVLDVVARQTLEDLSQKRHHIIL